MCGNFPCEVVSDSDDDNIVYELVLFHHLLDPASATEYVPESRLLHVGVVIEYHERERFLDHVGPDLAHVVVIPVVEEVDSACMRDARVCDALADGFDCLVIAVAVRARNVGTVDIASTIVSVQPLHKGLLGIDICGERARDFAGDEYHTVQEADALNDRLNRNLVEFLQNL